MSNTGFLIATRVLAKVQRGKQSQSWSPQCHWRDLQCAAESIGIISEALIKFVKPTSILPLVVIFRLTPKVAHTAQGGSVLGWGVVQDKCNKQNLGLEVTLPSHCPPSSSHPVAICSDAGQRNHRPIGVDQTTPQREGEQGGARQGVACHSTSSTGQYRMA